MNPHSSTGFHSLNDDTLNEIYEWTGKKSFLTLGFINKRCNALFHDDTDEKNKNKKETFYGFISRDSASEVFTELNRDKNSSRYEKQHELRKLNQGVAWGIVHDKNEKLLNWSLEMKDINLLTEICVLAGMEGKVEIIQDIFSRAGEALLSWLRDDVRLCDCCSEAGKLNALKYLRENGCSWSEKTCTYASKNGHLDILEYACDNGCEFNWNSCLVTAAGSGRLNVLQWINEYCRNGDSCPLLPSSSVSPSALMKMWGSEITAAAASSGNLKTLQFLRSQGCEWDADTCASAAENGHLEILKYLRANGCPWNFETYAYACFNGHMAIVNWILEHGCSSEDSLFDFDDEFD